MTLSEPTPTPNNDDNNEAYFLNGSIIDKLRQDYPDTANLAFAALNLTEAPLEVRRAFLEEYAQWMRDESEDPEVIENAASIASTNVAYATGSCGDPETCQTYLEAWQEADPEASHPYFGSKIPGTPVEAYGKGALDAIIDQNSHPN